MQEAEFAADADLVRQLLREQQPDLVSLSIEEVAEGWDNRLFRVGPELVARLPRRAIAAELTVHEHRWLPILAPRLPLPIQVPVRVGRPGQGFPWPWTIARWFEGETAAGGALDTDLAVAQLAEFLVALHQPAPEDAPVNPFRTSLPSRAEVFAERMSQLRERVDVDVAQSIWQLAVAARPWSGPALWLHGDLHPANLIVNDQRLAAVIDFGDLTAGDPAVDLAVAWMLWPAPRRRAFRENIERLSGWSDDATWTRARGWALHLGVAYLTDRNTAMEAIGHKTVSAALADRDA